MVAWRAHGFTYLALLFALAIGSVALAGAASMWSIEAQRERETALLSAGAAYRQAIGSYVESTPGGAGDYPAALADLLEDRRFNPPRRHLRRPYPEPVSGLGWALIRRPDGTIGGVYSVSQRAPLQRASFDEADEAFNAKERYADWKFVYIRHRTRDLPAVFLPGP